MPCAMASLIRSCPPFLRNISIECLFILTTDKKPPLVYKWQQYVCFVYNNQGKVKDARRMSLFFRHAPEACTRADRPFTEFTLNAFSPYTAKLPNLARIEQYYFSLQASMPPARKRIMAVTLFWICVKHLCLIHRNTLAPKSAYAMALLP